MNQFDNYELTTLDYALRYYLKENPNLDEEDIEWWHPLDSGINGRRPLVEA